MSLTFETAALADVVSRAARVAPTKGQAFDKSAGVLLDFDPTALKVATIKATDLDVSFLESIEPIASTEKDKFVWRIPASLMAGILANLPVGSNTQLEDKSGVLHITCGKAKAKIRMYAEVLTNFEPFDPSGLQEVPSFAERVAQVAWACDRNAIPFTGVHIDGDRLVATDRYRLVAVPLKVPVTEPITVPLEVLTLVAKGATDAKIAAVDKRLNVMPTEHTQITAVIYDAKYPPVERAMFRDHDQSCTIDRDALRNAITRMLVLVKGERYPIMRLTIGEGVIHVLMDVEEVGEMEDEIPVVGAEHPPFVIHFTPTNFVEGLSHASKNEVKFSYDTANDKHNVMFEDGDGYECWVVPRRTES